MASAEYAEVRELARVLVQTSGPSVDVIGMELVLRELY